MSNNRSNTRKLTGMALFTAIVVVLQFLGAFIRFGPFSPDCETVTVSLNHIPHTLRTEPCGDANWAWLEIDPNTLL